MSREEDPGLLGNLPRSRPGRRSDKRPDEAAPSRPPANREPAGRAQRQDRVGHALRAAASATGSGLRIANGMTRELLRRLPRRS
jgi:hypothetical protein